MSAFVRSVTGLAADQAKVVVDATLLFGRQELAVLSEEGLVSSVVRGLVGGVVGIVERTSRRRA